MKLDLKLRLIQFCALVLALNLLLPQPALADSPASADSPMQNANGEPIEAATDSDLSDIPNLEKMDYDTFQEYFGDVPGDHVPLLNPDNGKMQIQAKTPSGEKTITAKDLVQSK